VASINARKAALLLMSLDPGTAGELLKTAPTETITEIVAELACLNASGEPADDAGQPVQEFFSLLNRSTTQGLGTDAFVEKMLENAMGKDQSRQVLGQARQLAEARDPFAKIRLAPPENIAQALKGESSLVAGMVLSELPPAKSARMLSMLAEDVRGEAVSVMAGAGQVSPHIRLRVAGVVQKRLDELSGAAQTTIEPAREDTARLQHRKVALLLRGLKKEFRDSLLAQLSKDDEQVGSSVQNLMVIWQDIPILPDRPLQEVLRQMDSRQLALAIVDADEAVVRKIRANISERAAAMLDEEISLQSSPKAEEIETAREEILRLLREVNARGELTFEDS